MYIGEAYIPVRALLNVQEVDILEFRIGWRMIQLQNFGNRGIAKLQIQSAQTVAKKCR